MRISKKVPFSYLLGGIALLLFGLWLITSDTHEALVKFFGVVALVFGISFFVEFFKYFQISSFQLDLKDHNLIFDGKRYPLKQSSLTVEFPSKNSVTRVTLRVENELGSEIVFQNLVLCDHELETVLKLLQPYLKNKEILEQIAQNNDTLRLFDNGFALDNRVFSYDEIKQIKTTLVDLSGTYFLDFTITLKNGETIDKRLKGGSDEYAKAIYTKLKHRGDILVDCGKENSKDAFNIKQELIPYLFLFFYLIAAILIYFDHNFWIFALVLFFFNVFYFMTDTSYESKLCKKVKALFDKDSHIEGVSN